MSVSPSFADDSRVMSGECTLNKYKTNPQISRALTASIKTNGVNYAKLPNKWLSREESLHNKRIGPQWNSFRTSQNYSYVKWCTFANTFRKLNATFVKCRKTNLAQIALNRLRRFVLICVYTPIYHCRFTLMLVLFARCERGSLLRSFTQE